MLVFLVGYLFMRKFDTFNSPPCFSGVLCFLFTDLIMIAGSSEAFPPCRVWHASVLLLYSSIRLDHRKVAICCSVELASG